MFKIQELRGVLPALATPLKPDGGVDEPAIKRLVEHVLAGGVHGLLPLGSTGENASLEEPARRKVLAAVVEAAAGKVPVICGVVQSQVGAARADVRAAAELGAIAALVAPPFYYPIDQATVLAFYRRLADASPIPIFVYNIPQNTKVVTEPATLATLAREGAVVGIKDSSRLRVLRERLRGHARPPRVPRLHRQRHDAAGLTGHGRRGHDLRRGEHRPELGGEGLRRLRAR
jgi:Dihydrodipicolinate synthase/N-acetylneuraminate lyase